MTAAFDTLIVGSGHGGAQAAIALRQNGYTGTIGLVGEEAEPPYERPPLTKDYLTGKKAFERILMRPAAFWAERDIVLIAGRRVTGIDSPARTVVTGEGLTIGYGILIWATGGSPRRLVCSGHEAVGVHSVRNRADVDRLRRELATTDRICVIGGGFIGLEAAASLAVPGKQVTIIEAQDRLLARVTGPTLSGFYAREHDARGVAIRLGRIVSCIEEKGGRVTGVRLADGELIPAEIAIVGIGIEPAVGPLLAAGAAGGNGVAVDALCRTTLDDVYAIGDCARRANDYAGGAEMRIESVQNANDMALTVARDITGRPQAPRSVPWFWSDQYDLKLQTVGISTGFDAEVVRGDSGSRRFSVVYLRGGHVVALDCVNSTKDYVQGRALVMNGARPDPALLARSEVPLNDVADGEVSRG